MKTKLAVRLTVSEMNYMQLQELGTCMHCALHYVKTVGSEDDGQSCC